MDHSPLEMAAIYRLTDAATHARKRYNEIAVFKDDHSKRPEIIHLWFKMVEADIKLDEYITSITPEHQDK